MRPSGRAADQLRSIRITRNYTKHAEGSVLVEFGDTKVICTASIENGVPRFLKGQGQGWLTAEYGMLPRATGERNQREASRGKQGGRVGAANDHVRVRHQIQAIHFRELRLVPGAFTARQENDREDQKEPT